MRPIFFINIFYEISVNCFEQCYHLLVPPQIHPFSFGEDAVNSGEFITITCTVSKGDFPINISWVLNGLEISSIEGITTSNTNRRSNQLTIDSAQAHHSGEYICTVQNLVGVVKYSSYLNINGN